MAEDRVVPKATSGVRLIVLGGIVLAVLFVAYKLSYTNVPPARLAVAEMIVLASQARTPIAETLADHGTLEGHMDGLLPEAQSALPNTKGPFEWEVGFDGTIRGRSARYGVTLEFATKDQGQTWTCRVEPAEHAPRAGLCAGAK
jgi:hypothetical protein